MMDAMANLESETAPDLGALYRDVRSAFTAAVQALPDEAFGRKIPACNVWSVKDLVAHASGVVDDVTNGRLDGAGSDPWTELQVKAAKDVPVAELLARWSEQAPNLETLLSNSPPSMMTARLVIDMVTHLWDLAGVTGKRPEKDAAFTFALNGYASAFGHRIKKAELPAVRLSSGTWDYVAGAGNAEVTVEADDVEFFRGLSGRRSERQVLGWDWDDEPRPYIEYVSNFGELAPHEVNEAF